MKNNFEENFENNFNDNSNDDDDFLACDEINEITAKT